MKIINLFCWNENKSVFIWSGLKVNTIGDAGPLISLEQRRLDLKHFYENSDICIRNHFISVSIKCGIHSFLCLLGKLHCDDSLKHVVPVICVRFNVFVWLLLNPSARSTSWLDSSVHIHTEMGYWEQHIPRIHSQNELKNKDDRVLFLFRFVSHSISIFQLYNTFKNTFLVFPLP